MKSRHLLPLVLALLALGTLGASAQTVSSLGTLLSTPSGEKTSIAKLGQGKVTVVSFWATWCKPCKQEMEMMQPVYEKMKDLGVEYIAISIDNTKTMAKVTPYIKAKKYTFPILLDPNEEVFRALNGSQVPYTLVFKADGTLYTKHDGYLEGDEDKLVKELEELVGQKMGAVQGAESTPSTN